MLFFEIVDVCFRDTHCFLVFTYTLICDTYMWYVMCDMDMWYQISSYHIYVSYINVYVKTRKQYVW